ncbi:MAG: bifunctional (p)ppGpp synthetase/guanosine-3',5'-bis(diphosphate) 3'-pyrophosphohydrolase [Sinobacteraceae bacterium]|nr:bifunctional (p)ppGpp synthetase/guanosine-3',5'-bis(diphosphate) 3'-pyrophosphohydrolase [Nevskiaceae bacterium]
MRVVDAVPPVIQQAIDAAAALLQDEGWPQAALSTAAVAAGVVGALTDDAELAVAVLIREAQHQPGANSHLDPPLPKGLSSPTLAAIEGLARLGEFTASAHWDSAGGLHEAQAEVLRKMLLAIVADPRLVVARIGIQLARLRAAKGLTDAAQQRLAAETRAVFAPLANRLGIWQVKWELEDLAFRYLEPQDYRRIAAALAEKRIDRERYVEEFRGALQQRLLAEGITAEVSGRAKHMYSIHRKMQRKQLAFEELFDVRAVRILCASIRDCYAALGVVHGGWTYIPGEFDDYIATPKDNFYRSIHTAVIGPQSLPIEVQIRTQEMHQQAELGVAAHWLYKEGRQRDANYSQKIEWVRQLLEPMEDGATARDADFIDRVRSDLFEDRVYALTPRGEVVDLPRGATPLDFAYQVHTGLGHRCRGAKINGRIVPLTQTLANGEVVEIIAGKEESPSRDWLIQDGYLASPRSRAKLRSWFRRRDADVNEADGRAIVERELARFGARFDCVPMLARELKASDPRELFRWLGEGEINVAQLLRPLAARGAATTPPTEGISKPRRITPSRSAHGPLQLVGLGDLPLTVGRCCAPVAPEPVVGYLTLGRGVTVHAERCANLARMRSTHAARCLEVQWTDARGTSE